MIYENDYAYFIWKPAGLPSTWGDSPCLLTQLEQGAHGFHGGPEDHRMGREQVRQYILAKMHALLIVPVQNSEAVCSFLVHEFSHSEEYGLINRLDTPTSGFLYFAKSREQYTQHTKNQAERALKKHYIAQLHGDVRYHSKESFFIDFPLMHHLHLDDRMVAIVHDVQVKKGRGQQILSQSEVIFLEYDDDLDHSIVHIIINQGRRHQIRAHTSGVGYPVVGDSLYGKKHHGDQLHLRSIGFELLGDG